MSVCFSLIVLTASTFDRLLLMFCALRKWHVQEVQLVINNLRLDSGPLHGAHVGGTGSRL
jgi:hypothetical protein